MGKKGKGKRRGGEEEPENQTPPQLDDFGYLVAEFGLSEEEAKEYREAFDFLDESQRMWAGWKRAALLDFDHKPDRRMLAGGIHNSHRLQVALTSLHYRNLTRTLDATLKEVRQLRQEVAQLREEMGR